MVKPVCTRDRWLVSRAATALWRRRRRRRRKKVKSAYESLDARRPASWSRLTHGTGLRDWAKTGGRSQEKAREEKVLLSFNLFRGQSQKTFCTLYLYMWSKTAREQRKQIFNAYHNWNWLLIIVARTCLLHNMHLLHLCIRNNTIQMRYICANTSDRTDVHVWDGH